ncbi:MAG: hypothetical protein KDD56_06610 [Bdellovibrionales bacterium]|nr:hypothetical protein [Bdellovibrionales bacterium]
MSQVAYKYDLEQVKTLAEPVLVYSNDKPEQSTNLLSKEILILSLILIVLQITDGVLTGIGISHFGLQAEGNLLIRTLMQSFGYIEALVLVKFFAILVICGLCFLSSMITWIKTAMRAIIAIYLIAAIIPWTSILIHHL